MAQSLYGESNIMPPPGLGLIFSVVQRSKLSIVDKMQKRLFMCLGVAMAGTQTTRFLTRNEQQ